MSTDQLLPYFERELFTFRDSCREYAVQYLELENGEWQRLAAVPILPVGFAEDDALIAFPARSHPAYLVLTEYFSFPDKVNFVDISTWRRWSNGCRTASHSGH